MRRETQGSGCGIWDDSALGETQRESKRGRNSTQKQKISVEF